MTEQEARKAERDAIVAWLRVEAERLLAEGGYQTQGQAYSSAALLIERGDHMEGKDRIDQ